MDVPSPFCRTAGIRDRGQLTLPKEVRDALGVGPGDTLAFLVQKDGTCVVQPLRSGLDRHRGRVRVKEPQDFRSIRRSVLHEHALHVASADE